MSPLKCVPLKCALSHVGLVALSHVGLVALSHVGLVALSHPELVALSHTELVALSHTCLPHHHSSFPGHLSADAVSSPRPSSRSGLHASLPALARVSGERGRAQLQAHHPRRPGFLPPAWAILAGLACDLLPLPFLHSLGRKAHWPRAAHWPRGWAGGRGPPGMCHLSSRVDGAGDQNVLFGSQMCCLLSGQCPLLSERERGGAGTYRPACPRGRPGGLTVEGGGGSERLFSFGHMFASVWLRGRLPLSPRKNARLSPF